MTEPNLTEWRERAEFWATRDPSTIGRLYDKDAVAFAREVVALLDRLAQAWDEGWDSRDLHGPVTSIPNPYASKVERAGVALADVWDECVQECYHLGWMHDFARDDALARNPYRAAAPDDA